MKKKGIQITICMKWVKKLDNNLYEIRSKFVSNIQRAIYFLKVNNEYIITHGMNGIERYRKSELYEYHF